MKAANENSAHLQKPLLRQQQQSSEVARFTISENQRFANAGDQARLGIQVLLQKVADEKKTATLLSVSRWRIDG